MILVVVQIEVNRLFSLDRKTGEIRLKGSIDFEEESNYEMRVQAKDGAGLASHTKVIVEISDVNDNSPEIFLKSLKNPHSRECATWHRGGHHQCSG